MFSPTSLFSFLAFRQEQLDCIVKEIKSGKASLEYYRKDLLEQEIEYIIKELKK